MRSLKDWVFGLLALLIAVLIINVVFFVMPMISGLTRSFVPSRTITVSAQGMTVATPDEADITFSVVSQGSNPSTLSDNNNNKMLAVLQFVSSQGIASSDIATTNYDLSPNYNYDPTTSRNYITGYTLTQTVQVKIRDLGIVASTLGGLAPLGVNQIGGVNYTFQNPNEFVAIARANALTNAETEASQLAAQAGASLGPVVTVTESSYVPIPPGPIFAQAAGVGAMAASAPSLSPGTQNVTDMVNVTYELR
jgi:uncharacterized protein